ncbi:MAG: cation:proton antiporter [Chloroflexota bacterium]
MSPSVTLFNLVLVALTAFGLRLLLGALPGVRVPGVVFEILAGVVIGPAVLGLVQVDPVLDAVSLVGLAYVLFLSGAGVELCYARGRPLALAGAAFAASLLVGMGLGGLLTLGGFTSNALLVGIMLSGTGMAIVNPVLGAAHQRGTPFGRYVHVAGDLGVFAPMVLVALVFSHGAHWLSGTILVVSIVAAALALGATVMFAAHSRWIADLVGRLDDSSSQIRVRGTFALLLAMAALAGHLGLEVVLGAFLAGCIFAWLDCDARERHPLLSQKLEAIGFGIFVPVFFISVGVRLTLPDFSRDPRLLVLAVLVFAGLLIARAAATFAYRGVLGTRDAVAASLLLAVPGPFFIATSRIGVGTGDLSTEMASAMVLAAVAAMVVLPDLATRVLERHKAGSGSPVLAITEQGRAA